ncbi:MAG: hypothetical protein QXR53_04605, partial [Candidatus Norongarragalinales archaeon]
MVSLGMWDKKRGVIYPRHYSTKLAELFGIYAGDGSLSVYRRGTTVEYRLTISGSIADYSYLQHVDSVIRSLFNLGSKVLVRIWKNKRWTVLVYRSKAVVTYFEENGFPPRRKEHLFIP